MSATSVLLQQGPTFELVITDDASAENHFEEIQSFVSKLFPKATVRYVAGTKNRKTVLNLLKGVSSSTGFISKELGAGDLLYDASTLESICNHFHSTGTLMGFGSEVKYTELPNNEIVTAPFDAPKSNLLKTEPSALDHTGQAVLIAKNADWIPGPTQFYEKEVFKRLLTKLSDEYGVLYCEDFTSVLGLFEAEMSFLPKPLVWYKWGDGISTNGSKESRKRMYADHRSFYNGIKREHSSVPGVRTACALFALREFAALHTPIAGLLQRFVANSYESSRSVTYTPTSLFNETRAIVDTYLRQEKVRNSGVEHEGPTPPKQ